MAMGWGCNAAAIVSTRIIDSPRERLIAIISVSLVDGELDTDNNRWEAPFFVNEPA